jgi:2-aminoadipate transaminase
MQRMQRSTIREILKITQRKEVISFAGGLPAPELFPLREFTVALRETLRKDGATALQYDVTEGYLPLKEYLCRWLSRQGITCTPDRLMLTNGSQQALDLLGKILINPGDAVLVENPTYLGAIQAFNAYQPRYVSMPMDEQGMRLSNLEKTLRRHHPKIAYLVPTFQNPSGITMSLRRRQTFLQIARRHKLLILEDDPYGSLRFSGKKVPSLYQLSRGQGVVYFSTFSKILSPGIRLGYVVAEPEVIAALVLAKQAADLQPNSFIQRAVYHYAQRGFLDRHIPRIIAAYRKRASWMLESMEKYFPEGVQWVKPQGGMFVWCQLPPGLSTARLFKEAIRHRVAFVDGAVFHANGGGENTFRLNFTNSSRQQIQEGIRRLGQVLTRLMPRSKRAATARGNPTTLS